MNQPIQPLDTPIMLFDGTSVSNTGSAAAAAIILLPNGRRYTVSQFLSLATDTEAEYTGLLIGLKKAKQLGIKALEIKGDSELVFNQVNGLAPLPEKNLQTLYQEVQKLMLTFERVSLECIPIEQNRSAVAAVNRCIQEALGREARPPQPIAEPRDPDITRFLKLGRKATDKDYRDLETPLDEVAFKALSELRDLVSEVARDVIALRWDGNDQHLADIYRWYLRGLPAEMALKKVAIDNPPSVQEAEKLPWEGELLGIISSDDPIADGKLSTLSDGALWAIESSEPFVSNPSVEVPTLKATPSPPPNLASIADRETLLSFPFDAPEESAQQTIPESDLEPIIDPNKDTIPSTVKVRHIALMLETLSTQERSLLVHQLVQSADWVNLVLKAIAERMAEGNVKDYTAP